MRIIITLISIFTLGIHVKSQTLQKVSNFYLNIRKSDSLYKVGEFKSSLEIKEKEYKWLLSINQLAKTPKFYSIPYDIVCLYSLTNKIKKGYKLLNKLINQPRFIFLDELFTDKDLKKLRADKRWSTTEKKIKEKIELRKKSIDSSLFNILSEIREQDQKPRFEYLDTIKKYGSKSNQAISKAKNILFNDSINLNKLTNLLDNGWPELSKVGEQGEQTIYLVIQHAPLHTQEKYLPQMEYVVKKGYVQPSDLAYLKDRILWRRKELQIYGSQVKADTHGAALYPYPLEDPYNVNVRRFNVGLYSMEEYMEKMNSSWNPNDYVKILPELIDNLKSNK